MDHYLEALRVCNPSPDLCRPVLWHPDLHRSNIFVSNQAPYSLIGLIDWQYAGISPFFTHTMLPKAFAYDSGRVQFVPDSPRQPLPSNFADLSEEEKKLTLDDQFDAAMRTLYEHIMKGNVPQHIMHTNPGANILMGPYAAYPATWADGLGKMKYTLALLQYEWDAVAPSETECPYNFSEEEVEKIIAEANRISTYDEKVECVGQELKEQGDGWVPNELYEVAMMKNKEFHLQWNEEENGGPYPFQEGASSMQT